MDIREARDLFLAYIHAERGYSPLTVAAYRSEIRQFTRFLECHDRGLSVEEVQTTDIRDFVASLQAKGLRPQTIARRINCLRSFFNFLWANQYVSGSPCLQITTPKKAGKLPTILTEEECRALLEAAYDCHYTMLGFRDRAILSLLLYTGLRRQESLDIQMDDIDLKQGWLRVRRGKGNKMRLVPVVPEVISAVEDWLEFRPICQHQSLFTTLTGKPLGRHGLQNLFKKALKSAGISRPGITVHSLRHTCASLLLKNGCDLVSIKEILGHASLESTSVYLHTDLSTLRTAIAKHPLRESERDT